MAQIDFSKPISFIRPVHNEDVSNQLNTVGALKAPDLACPGNPPTS